MSRNYELSRSMRTMIGMGVVGVLAQAAWATLNFSSLPVWVEYHLKQSRFLGIVIAAFMVAEAIFRPVFGAVSDMVGRKPVLIAGILVGFATSFTIVFLPNIWLMIPLTTLDGLGLAAFWPASFSLLGDTVAERHRSTAMSILNGSSMAGVAIGWFLGGLTNDLTHSLSGSFYFVAVLFILAAVAAWLILPEGWQRPENVRNEPHMGLIERLRWSETVEIIRLVPDMLVINLIVFVGIGLIMPIMKLYTMQQYGVTETQFGAIVGPAALMLGLLAVVAGSLSDRWGHIKSVMFGLFLTALGMWFVPAFHRLWVATLAAIVVGIGFVLAYPSWMAIASGSTTGDRRGRVIGAVGMAEGIGAIIGVILGPYIFAAKGLSVFGIQHPDLPFYITAILLTIATVLGFTWVKSRRELGELQNHGG